MNPRHLATLEFPKVLDRLAGYASFSVGEEKAHALTPAISLREIQKRLEITSEARALLELRAGVSVGGARDVRPLVEAARRESVLSPPELLDVRHTLVAAHDLRRALVPLKERFPRLVALAERLSPCQDVLVEIDRCLDERSNVRDEASPELARIRSETRVAHERLLAKLQGIITSPDKAMFLQEPIITQREGRYVLPLKADFKGRIRGIVHDVSASGATIFVEPLSVVDLNNAWRELLLAESREIERILAALSALIADYGVEIEQTVEALADLDLALAKARYAADLRAVAPEIVPFRTTDTRASPCATVRLVGARHPLLDPHTVVPIDVVLDRDTHVLIITGPNTGGKTVSLKTVGLLTAMAQAGLHIPVEPGSALSPFEAIYADIGDEQSIEQSLSTFSAHLTNILSFLDRVDARSLVLLDELGAGTDPTEGAALARALLERLRARGATVLVATHYPELKSYAQLTPGVCNACVEFDPESLRPTYKLTIGLPGRSNAFAIACRLGMPDEVIESARALVSSVDLRAEDMLADIHQLRLQAARARDEALAARAEAEKLAQTLRERLRAVDRERQEVLDRAREQAEADLEELSAEIRALRRRLQAAAEPMETVARIEADAVQLRDRFEESQPVESESSAFLPSIRPGDLVWVRPLNARGEVLAILDGEVEVQVGPARARVAVSDLDPAPEAKASPSAAPLGERADLRLARSPGEQIDVRSLTVEEAVARVEKRLDAAFRAGLPWVRIVHGKGTGALRRAVRELLARHPLVSACEPGDEREGGEGVTIARLG